MHVQTPARWEDTTNDTEFQTGLIGPEDEPAGTTYLELFVRSALLKVRVHAILRPAGVRRLRDQLSAHLDAVLAARRNRLVGGGQLLMASDQPTCTGGEGNVDRGLGSAAVSERSPRPQLDEQQELEALRAAARCGRSLPWLHLAELEEVRAQRWRPHRVPIMLCGVDVDTDDMADRDDDDCPGCADCVHYCPDCVRVAVRWSAQRDGAGAGGRG